MNFTELVEVIKMIGKEAIMELVKSKWIQFSVGFSILMWSSEGFIKALAAAVK